MTVASVMKPAAVTLRESDTVMRAVHELVNRRLLIVPILDDGGTLTGLFGVHRLVELLLPGAPTARNGILDLSFVHDSLDDFRDRMRELAAQLVGDLVQRKLHDIQDHPISQYLHGQPVVVHPSTQLMEALLLLYHTHSTLPVVEEEKPKRFLGIVSYWNVLDALSGGPSRR